jgi:WD40 repeat protein
VAGAGTRGDIYLWDLAAGGHAIHKLTADGAPLPDLTVLNEMGSLTFSPDGSQIAGGAFMAVALWDTATGKLTRRLPSHKSGTAAVVRFSPDGKKLTTVRDFVGTNGPDGKDLLVYLVVNEWDLERDGKPVSQ